MSGINIEVCSKKLLNVDDRFTGIRFPANTGHKIFRWPFLGIRDGKQVRIVGNGELLNNFNGDRVAVFLVEEANPLSLLKKVCEYYNTQRPLNLIEKSNLLKLDKKLDVSKANLVKEICPILNVPPKRDIVEDLLYLQKLPETLKLYVVEKSMSLKLVKLFQRCGEDFNWVERIITKGKVSLGILLEMVTNIWEVSQRDEKTINEVLEKLRLTSDINPKKIADIRLKLTQLQYPMLTKINNLVESEVKKLQLPKGVHISWDRTFEQEGIEIHIHACNEDELRRAVRTIDETNMVPLFESINFNTKSSS